MIQCHSVETEASLFLFFFQFSEKNALGYVLLIVSFSMAWVETWFLDFKVLPSEKKAKRRGMQIFTFLFS